MKRHLNRNGGFFKRLGIEATIGLVIGIIVTVTITVLAVTIVDIIPATEADYEELESQLVAIQQNPDLLLKTHCKISVKDNIITVTVMNNECEMSADFNQDYEVLSTTKTDYATHWVFIFLAILVALLYGLLSCIIATGIASWVRERLEIWRDFKIAH